MKYDKRNLDTIRNAKETIIPNLVNRKTRKQKNKLDNSKDALKIFFLRIDFVFIYSLLV